MISRNAIFSSLSKVKKTLNDETLSQDEKLKTIDSIVDRTVPQMCNYPASDECPSCKNGYCMTNAKCSYRMPKINNLTKIKENQTI